jgi:rod shape determining protein RodA
VKTLRTILLRVLTTRAAWPILACVGLLCAFSIDALELASPERADKQWMWLSIGVGVIVMTLVPHYHWLGRISYGLYALTMVLLVAVFFAPPVAGTHRWYVLPGDVNLQPSELAKIAFVLTLAWHLRHRKNIRTLEGLIVPFGLAIVPFALILMEPDLGTAMLFPLVLYAMLLAAGARMRHLVIIAVVALFAMPGAYPFLRPYQQDRVKTLIITALGREDEYLRYSKNLQAHNSQLAISSGGTSGQGSEGTLPLHQPAFLPAAYTDFIFAVIGAEWGYVGCMLVILFYLGFFAASVEIASSTRDDYGRLLVVGTACMILFQATMNLSMTVGLVPVVGVALPFVSYGGSSLLASMLGAGLLLNVSVRRGS